MARGELDWIVMKALEKDRQRRYETANGLAMNIRRYLSGEAVVAAPPSTAYQFKKFIRGNRVMVTTGTAVAVALVLGMVGIIWQATVASSQRDRARNEAARAAKDESRELSAEAAATEQRDLAQVRLDESLVREARSPIMLATPERTPGRPQ